MLLLLEGQALASPREGIHTCRVARRREESYRDQVVVGDIASNEGKDSNCMEGIEP